METRVRPRIAVDVGTLAWCLVLSVSTFGVVWLAPAIPFAVVAMRHVDFESARTIQWLMWMQTGIVTLCLVVALWSGRSVWKRLVGKASVSSAGARQEDVVAAVATIVLCLIVGIVVKAFVTGWQ